MYSLKSSKESTQDSNITDKNIPATTLPFSSPKFLFSPISYLSKKVRDFLIKTLQHGPIPQHIGFIMDGNRRFARKVKVQTTKGHYMGFAKMEEVLDICLQLGIKVVTVYAFSIENFKRPKEEVDGLMQLAKAKLIELCQNSQVVKKHGISIRILGNMSYLPQDLREVMEEAIETTKDNDRSILNICAPYTSRDEITNSVKTIAKMVENKQIHIEDIDENLIERCLFTHGCPPLEILIRTSELFLARIFDLGDVTNHFRVSTYL
ncbi:13572_t:CDS:2 [Funneliformis geosporum]|uniref:Alkyl transferase n=1 Tax=Funneliformis geosporum TaxID=1117311 RepID=A0A9W4SQT6_9GLOM|nr:13572_t:CDS:2 [Funneliformis geosporum]